MIFDLLLICMEFVLLMMGNHCVSLDCSVAIIRFNFRKVALWRIILNLRSPGDHSGGHIHLTNDDELDQLIGGIFRS